MFERNKPKIMYIIYGKYKLEHIKLDNIKVTFLKYQFSYLEEEQKPCSILVDVRFPRSTQYFKEVFFITKKYF